MEDGVLLAPRRRIAAAVAGVVALHAAALALLWPPATPAGRGPDGARSAVVTAALLAPPARPAPPEPRHFAPPSPRDRPRTIPVAPEASPPPQHDGLPPLATDANAVLSEVSPSSAARPEAAEADNPRDEPHPFKSSAAAAAESTPAAPMLPAGPSDTAATWRPPPPSRLDYDVLGEARGLNYHAQATLDWHWEGERYRVELALRAFLVGTRTQTSAGTVTGQGLQPLRFEDRARRTRGLTFEWPATGAPAHARSDDGTWLEGLPSGTQDRLSVFIQLGTWVQGAQPGERWSLPVMGGNQVETWTFEAVGHEYLALPAGEFDALRVRRSPLGAAERDVGVELWFSSVLPGLPVRIVLQQANGDRVEQRLRAWRSVGPP